MAIDVLRQYFPWSDQQSKSIAIKSLVQKHLKESIWRFYEKEKEAERGQYKYHCANCKKPIKINLAQLSDPAQLFCGDCNYLDHLAMAIVHSRKLMKELQAKMRENLGGTVLKD